MLFKSLFALQFLTINLITASLIKPTECEDKQNPSSDGLTKPPQTSQDEAICYKGNQFPPVEKWLSFDKLWAINSLVMLRFDSQSELDAIWKYIGDAAAAAGIDKKILLTIMMQESNGNVRTVSGDGVTPGLMQALGSASCVDSVFGECPISTIKDMIFAGALGTGQTQGLASCFAMHHWQYGPMLRCYNSGSVIDPLNLDNVKFGTPSYVSDIANRLRGFEPRRDCGFEKGIPSPGH
ncbi:hypothetical protein EMCG_04599 [[Emmonsia] crescens]|uniref:Transglycosylase SLT domain-containing protein n=1 Tax=[Emmonsia] crescens TaxID=73230 RepID=A0A0G2HRI6_9EURO|nr:hypothetical protein EMCG_04599 [Emmonsia crescens UAMH 3008]